MARRHVPEKRQIVPDPKYHDKVIAKFINMLMEDGKKSTAERITYGAFDIISEKLNDDPVKVFKKALSNVKPSVEVRSRRVGGATYQVPIEVRQERGTALGMRWLIKAARSRNDKSMSIRLSRELIDASNNEGGAVRKKDETHRMADANKAFAHFRF